MRGPLTGLLLFYRRRSARSEGIEVLGATQPLDFWLEWVSFEWSGDRPNYVADA